MCNFNTYNGCDEYSNDSTIYKPCEHIDDIMKILNIEETNEKNNKIIRDYLFDNCCSKQYSKFYYLRQFILNKIKYFISKTNGK